MLTASLTARSTVLPPTFRRLGIFAVALLLTGTLSGCGYFSGAPEIDAAEKSADAADERTGKESGEVEGEATQTAGKESDSENGVELLPAPGASGESSKQETADADPDADGKATEPVADSSTEEAIPLPVADDDSDSGRPIGVVPGNRSVHAKIRDGIDRAELVLVDDAATPEEQAAAWMEKIRNQYDGARRNWLDYEEQLARTVDQLKNESEFLDEAEYGSALILSLRYFDGEAPAHDVVRMLTDHCKAFPGGKTHVKLFLSFAGALAMRDKMDDAVRCCGVAQWVLKDHPQIGLIHQFRRKIEKGTLITIQELREQQLKEMQANDPVQKRIEKEVAQIREMMPIKVDAITTLTDITTEWHTINYTYRVLAPRSEIMKKRKEIESRIRGLAKSVFGTMELINKGVTLNYRYNDKGDWRMFEFSISK